MESKQSKSYYFNTVKIVRDLVHGYVNLTEFDLKLIDTDYFQRLKDIRQLTCQDVYPAARHTRFEHSLGVLELTRRAIRHLNKNGFIAGTTEINHKRVISEQLEFNACLAAVLHDVGHCPFSHMGESEFDSKTVKEYLYEIIEETGEIQWSADLLSRIKQVNAKDIGSVHEQLSCIIILQGYVSVLSNLNERARNNGDECEIEVDFELIVRSILGIEYDVSTATLYKENKEKNIIVRLINSKIFDMDKLDYIIRDSFFTGIGTPEIDTERLFRNMYLSDRFTIVFTSKAVPALQNMIDSRDGLYMYVYNHHAVVFSDFMNTYISRRLSHNANMFLRKVYPEMSEEEMEMELECFQISLLGLIPKPYLFSVQAVVGEKRSDSDWLSLLNIIHTHSWDEQDTVMLNVRTEMLNLAGDENVNDDDVEKVTKKILSTYSLIHEYKTRHFLKPWWKTVFEFSNFMYQYFRDDNIRRIIGKWICSGGEYGLDSAEIRSQIAKHVIYITENINNRYPAIVEPLHEGEFFVIQRSNRFFAPNTIESLEICLKNSEITGPPVEVNYQMQEYYVKSLTNIIPQKDYSAIYAKEGFYIFSKPISKVKHDDMKRREHYKALERIFVFVATEFVHRGEQDFMERFQANKRGNMKDEIESRNEIKSKEEMLLLLSKGERLL